MSICEKQLRNVISSLLRQIPIFYSQEAVTLQMMTAAVESDLGYFAFYQKGGGPGRGIMQVEIATMMDNYINYLDYPSRAWLKKLIGDITGVYEPSADALEYNTAFNIMMARLKYYRSPGPIPKTLEGMAKYHEKNYNAHEGNYASTGKEDWEITLEKYRSFVG